MVSLEKGQKIYACNFVTQVRMFYLAECDGAPRSCTRLATAMLPEVSFLTCSHGKHCCIQHSSHLYKALGAVILFYCVLGSKKGDVPWWVRILVSQEDKSSIYFSFSWIYCTLLSQLYLPGIPYINILA